MIVAVFYHEVNAGIGSKVMIIFRVIVLALSVMIKKVVGEMLG